MAFLSEKHIIIGVGSNKYPDQEHITYHIKRAVKLLNTDRVRVIAHSRYYKTTSLENKTQSRFVNAVIAVQTSLSPVSLFFRLKQIEKIEGRRGYSRPWGDRTLDLDIIDYKSFIWNWNIRAQKPEKYYRNHIILPHAHAHSRYFVLQPLQDIIPEWKHPVFHLNADQLLQKIKLDTDQLGGEILEVF